jgi:hypothetical protein
LANSAVGFSALSANTVGINNTALGFGALSRNTTGSGNLAVGESAGSNLTTGSNNIALGSVGNAGDNNSIYIGTASVHTNTIIAGIFGATVSGGTTVFINSSGKLGTVTSSARFKQDIQEMSSASEVLLALRPVTFRYKPEIDSKGTRQFGLIAEEVEQVDPDLVVRDEQQGIYSVRYEAVNAMLLNEFLKQHRTVEAQKAELQELKRSVAELQRLVNKLAGAGNVGVQ